MMEDFNFSDKTEEGRDYEEEFNLKEEREKLTSSFITRAKDESDIVFLIKWLSEEMENLDNEFIKRLRLFPIDCYDMNDKKTYLKISIEDINKLAGDKLNGN